jgi:hypothetical protein
MSHQIPSKKCVSLSDGWAMVDPRCCLAEAAAEFHEKTTRQGLDPKNGIIIIIITTPITNRRNGTLYKYKAFH